MEKAEIIERHGYYYRTLEKLANEFSFYKPVKISDLKPPRGVVQRAYKEMENCKFEGNLIDYLCWISLMIPMLFIKRNKRFEDNLLFKYKDRDKYKQVELELDTDIKNSMFMYLNIIYDTYKEDFINSVRLFVKNEDYLDKAIDLVCKFNDSQIREICIGSVKTYLKSLVDVWETEITKNIKLS
jgi:hypothetical protein